jgi:hypothetical protein
MVESENNQDEIRRFAKVVGCGSWHDCGSVSYVKAAEIAIRKELEIRENSQDAGFLRQLCSFDHLKAAVLVADNDSFTGSRLIRANISLKFEFSSRQPGANE